MKNTLLAGLPALDLTLSNQQADTMCRFGELLLEKNKVMNLTAIKTPEGVAKLHFLDSLALLDAYNFDGKTVVDVGCGAGFPGVPLKIGCPGMDLTLLDSLGKRMDWLREVLPGLGVEAKVVTARAEDHAKNFRESYDICVSRAVARLNVLAELCLPLVKVGGCFLSMKGALAMEEVDEAEKALSTLGGRILDVRPYEIDDATHYAVVVEKVRPTPVQYPRDFARIKKKPL